MTGLEARFIAEVSRAALGLKRQDASGLAAEILTRYQATLPNPNRGKSFPEVYDIETVQPKAEWLDMYYDSERGPDRPGSGVQARAAAGERRKELSMSIPESISERLTQALTEGEADDAEAVALEALQTNLDPLLK